jgi:predicted nucleotidyltransferase
MKISSVQIPKDKIIDYCQRWKITEFALFGSVLRDDFEPTSDIDILVSFDADTKWTLLDHVQMQDELGTLFGRDVDLVSRRGLENSRNRIRREEILNSAQVIYVSS